MQVTSALVYPVDQAPNERMLAFASVTFDDEFVVHNVRLVLANRGPIVAMPNERYNGEWQDIAHPINNNCRQKIREAIIDKYNEIVSSSRTLAVDSAG